MRVKTKNTQTRYEEENENLKELTLEQKSKIILLQKDNQKLENGNTEQKRLVTKLTTDLEKLAHEMKLKVNEVEALKRFEC